MFAILNTYTGELWSEPPEGGKYRPAIFDKAAQAQAYRDVEVIRVRTEENLEISPQEAVVVKLNFVQDRTDEDDPDFDYEDAHGITGDAEPKDIHAAIDAAMKGGKT